MKRTQADWIKAYQDKEALWIHDGNMKRPHALLTSGKHSNGFFNSRRVIPDETLLLEAASNLISVVVEERLGLTEVHGIVGPQTGATKLAELIRDSIPVFDQNNRCFWASPAKQETDGKKSMVFSTEEVALLPNSNILLCEDVFTTGGSVELASDAVLAAGGIILPFVLVLVNRSGLTINNGKRIIALIDHAMPMWEKDECPLCKQGSEAIAPKDPANWAKLNAEY